MGETGRDNDMGPAQREGRPVPLAQHPPKARTHPETRPAALGYAPKQAGSGTELSTLPALEIHLPGLMFCPATSYDSGR